jgi:hypothetical protein
MLAMDGSGQWTDFHYSSHGQMEDNATSPTDLICRQEQGSPLPITVTTANILRYIQVIYYMICLPTAVFLNTFVISIVIRFKQLHTLTFYFSLQIIIIDLLNAAIIFPSSAANAIADRFIFTDLCNTFAIFISFFRFARNMLMFVLVVDRFCTVFLPFWYNSRRPKSITVLSIVAWIVTMIFIVINASLGCYQFQRSIWTCFLGTGCRNRTFCGAFAIIFTAVMNVSSFISFLLYVALRQKAKKLRNRVLPSSSGDNESIEEAWERERRRKSERRANTTFFILFTAILGVTFPAYLMSIFGEAALYIFEDTPPAAYTIVTVLLRGTPNLITVLDPIVIMRNQDVREVIRIIVNNVKRTQREAQQPEQL